MNIDHAQKAIEFFYPGIEVGAPQPFAHGYDNSNGGDASLAEFNDLCKEVTAYPVTGTFGIPDGLAGDLQSDYPEPGSTWIGISFILQPDMNTVIWTGTAVSPGDVVISLDMSGQFFFGTLGGLPDISGNANPDGPGGEWITLDGLYTRSEVVAVFFGKLSFSVANDGEFPTENHLIGITYFDLKADKFVYCLNIKKSFSGDTTDCFTGTTENILLSYVIAAQQFNCNFSGYLFPLKQL